MLSFIFSLLQGLLSLAGWAKSNKDQQIGQQTQELTDAKHALDQAAEAARIQQQVGNKSTTQLDADLDKRVHRHPSDD